MHFKAGMMKPGDKSTRSIRDPKTGREIVVVKIKRPVKPCQGN
jgi:hypothetical protein